MVGVDGASAIAGVGVRNWSVSFRSCAQKIMSRVFTQKDVFLSPDSELCV
jgi:hypothetical protein